MLTMKSLLPITSFDPVFSSLKGKRVGWLKMHGNVGDRMIDWATEQLFDHFDIEFGTLNWLDGDSDVNQVLGDIDIIVVAGGGNLGDLYTNCKDLRSQYLGQGRPIYVLPQSLTNLNEDLTQYEKVFLRENASHNMYPDSVLAPDLALGFTPPTLSVHKKYPLGIFLREDVENITGFSESSLGDPAVMCDSVSEYLQLANRFELIYTDRIHFAICGLLTGARVHLLPGSYHKNRGLFETWLKDLGCSWCEHVDEVPTLDLRIFNDEYKNFTMPASQQLSWNFTPQLVDEFVKKPLADKIMVGRLGGNALLEVGKDASIVLDTIDGKSSVAKVVEKSSTHWDIPYLDGARDVQFLLKEFRDKGLFKKHPVSSFRNLDGQLLNGRYLELHVEDPVFVGPKLRIQATIKCKGEEPKVVWFETDNAMNDREQSFTEKADAFVLVCLLPAMRAGLPLIVSGLSVSPGLLKNLYEFQLVFNAWYPNLSIVEIIADAEHTETQRSGAIAAYSGGIDSTYTIAQQSTSPHPLRDYNLRSAVFVRGFDIYVSSAKTFELAFLKARKNISFSEVELVNINTNVREIYSEWKRFHGLGIAGVLSLFNHEFSKGLLSSTIPYKMLYPFGSNAITDRMLGSDSFEIIHDGAEKSRFEKTDVFFKQNISTSNIRFCYVNKRVHENCGKCYKCIVTAVLLRARQLPLDCFENELTSDDFDTILSQYALTLKINSLDYHDLQEASIFFKNNDDIPSWYGALEDILQQAKVNSSIH